MFLEEALECPSICCCW